MSSDQSFLLLSAHFGAFLDDGRRGGTAEFRRGDGALEEAERLNCCPERTVQLSVWILLSIHIDLSFHGNFIVASNYA